MADMRTALSGGYAEQMAPMIDPRYAGMTHTGQEPVGMDTVRAFQAMPGQIANWAQANPLDAGALAVSPFPVVGDALGFANDMRNMIQNPEERTWGNAALAGAGLLPFVPPIAGIVRGAKGVDDMASALGGGKSLLSAEERAAKTSALRAEGNAQRFGYDVNDPELARKAALTDELKNYFGTTRSANETGYILPDGTRLDLSGRHAAGGYTKKGDSFVADSGKPDYLANSRNTDHREISDIAGINESEHQWGAVEQLLTDTGAVRYMPGQGFSIIKGQPVSDKQLRSIIGDFRKSGQPMNVDIDPPGGWSKAESKYFERPNFDEVKRFISENSMTDALTGTK